MMAVRSPAPMSSAPQSAGLDLVPPTSAPGAPVGPAPAAPSNPPPTAQSGARRGASSVVASVILTALTIAGVEVCARAIGPIPSPSPILLLAVCTSAFIGGLPSGIISAGMCMLYGAFYFSAPHWPLRYDGEHPMRVVILSVTAPAMAILVGLLRRRAERAAAEVSRQQSEQRFLQTFDRAAVGMATISLSGRWLRVNPELCQILGHSCERLEGGNWQDTVVPDDAAVLSTHLQKLLTGEIDWFQADARHTRGDTSHELIWTQQTITLIRDDQGRPDHLVAVVNDVSDRKAAEDARRRAQEAMRRSERQFRQAIIDAPIPVMMHAEDGQILQLSGAWTDYTGYTIADIPTFQDWLRVAFAADDKNERARDNVAALFAGPSAKEIRDQEFVITTKSGERRTWSFSASSPGVLEDGRRYVVTMARDITFRRRAQEQLAASELRYRSLVTATAQVVWRTAPAGETLEDLPMWREFTGQTYDEMKSLGWLAVVHP